MARGNCEKDPGQNTNTSIVGRRGSDSRNWCSKWKLQDEESASRKVQHGFAAGAARFAQGATRLRQGCRALRARCSAASGRVQRASRKVQRGFAAGAARFAQGAARL